MSEITEQNIKYRVIRTRKGKKPRCLKIFTDKEKAEDFVKSGNDYEKNYYPKSSMKLHIEEK